MNTRELKKLVSSLSPSQKEKMLSVIELKRYVCTFEGKELNKEQLSIVTKLLKGEPVKEVRAKPKNTNSKVRVGKIKMPGASWDKL